MGNFILLVEASVILYTTQIPSGKLTSQWKVPFFSRKHIFEWSICHSYVSLLECKFLFTSSSGSSLCLRSGLSPKLRQMFAASSAIATACTVIYAPKMEGHNTTKVPSNLANQTRQKTNIGNRCQGLAAGG